MKKCKQCESTDLATRSTMCKEHHREYVRNHYRANKQAYIEKAKRRNARVMKEHRELVRAYLSEHSCVDCNNDDIEVLQFDHRDRADKITEIGNLLTGSTTRLLAEIAKCDVRCANCHIKRTRRQLGWWYNAIIDAEILTA